MHFLKKWISLFYIICRAIIPPRKVSGGNRILIVDGGHIGDIAFDASAWYTLAEHSASQGKEVYVLATKEAWNTLRKFLKTDQVQYVECGKDLHDVHAIEYALRKLKNFELEMVVVRLHCFRRLYPLTAALSAKDRHVVVEGELLQTVKDRVIHRMFQGRYTNVIIEDENSSEKDAIEKLMHTLGYDDYHMRILPIPCQGEAPISADGSYITIALDSQNTARRWPEERFISLIGELLRLFKEDIVLTGSFLDEAAALKYEAAFRGNARVKNMVGKLSFGQWIELLRGARFHIGVDSGSIHVAAAVNTVAFCLTGYWHMRRFFPYQDDMIGPGTAMPVCVYRKDIEAKELHCSGCAIKRRYGEGNRACLKQIRKGKPCLCLQEIQVGDVLAAIGEAMNSGVI